MAVDAGRVLLTTRDNMARITFANEARRNAMSLAMWEQLGDVLASLGPDIRCLILQGAGDKAFVAGADISEFGSNRRSPADVEYYDRCSDEAMKSLHGLAIPTVAMISGFCIGGGMALALCCDVRLAAENSQFAIPAGRLGLGYPVSGIRRLLDAVSVPVATDILISARRFGAQEALQVGLVNRVHATADIAAQVDAYAEAVIRNAPLTLRAAKRTIRELTKGAAPDTQACNDLIDACFASGDYLEGVNAFSAKREPQFQGR